MNKTYVQKFNVPIVKICSVKIICGLLDEKTKTIDNF